MLLVHLSDIHFREPDCTNPDHDPDRPYRTRMIQDVRERVRKIGNVDAILIGGDIAFKGHPAEYEAAKNWIDEFAAACGCPLERVFVVPGNHDVDRGVVARSAAVRNAHAAIHAADPSRREREFRAQITDPETGHTLLKPLEAFNEFAKIFSCQIYAPDRLYWKQDIPLAEGISMRVYGLTSVFLSGAQGRDDTRESLYMSPLQTGLDPVDDVINVVMSHHPPDWFCDQDDVDEKICNRAALHFFGHKHRQRITMENAYVRFSAGAVNPDRGELGWQPAYNIVEVRVTGQGEARALEVDAHLLQWQTNPEQYRPLLTSRGEAVFRHKISIPGRLHERATHSANFANTPTSPGPVVAESNAEVAMSSETARNLIFRFWNLTVSQRRDIALKLALVNEDEWKLPEPERYGRALLRASERHLLNSVADEITKWERL